MIMNYVRSVLPSCCVHWCPSQCLFHPNQPNYGLPTKQNCKPWFKVGWQSQFVQFIYIVTSCWSCFFYGPFCASPYKTSQVSNPLMRWGSIMRKETQDVLYSSYCEEKNLCPINEGQLNTEASSAFLHLPKTLGITKIKKKITSHNLLNSPGPCWDVASLRLGITEFC